MQSLSINSNKVEIVLRPVGSAPILKKKKFTLDRTKNVKWLAEWLKKYMKLDSKEQLFLYVNQEFAPSLDTEIGTIFDCFGITNNLIFNYCTTPAWG
jgi:ubiquitin-like protein ATG12